MAVTPLSRAQKQALDDLVARQRLQPVQADPQRAATFMRSAHDRLADVTNVTKPQNQYTLSYDACHDIGEALLAAHGYRTTNGPGQHDALGRFLRVVFDAPPADAAAGRFDTLRQARNKLHYAGKPVTSADAQAAAATAQELYGAALERGLGT